MTAQEYKNEDITALVNQKEGCEVTIELSASPKLAQKAYAEAVKNVKKEVSIPGFRKGKVPDKMLLTKYSQEIEREFKELFMQESTTQALSLCKLYPWNRQQSIKADVIEVSQEKGGKIKIEFECQPHIPDIKPEELAIHAHKTKEISSEDVDNHLEGLCYQHAEWSEVEGRPLQDGDFIDVEREIATDSKEPIHDDVRLVLRKGKTEKEVYDALIGKSVGHKATLKIHAEDEHEKCDHDHPEQNLFEAEVSHPSGPVKVTVKKIWTAKTPEINDDFAKTFKADSLEDLKKKIKTLLEGRAIDESRSKNRHSIEHVILDKYNFDIPSTILKKEVEEAKNDITDKLRESGVNDSRLKELKARIEDAAKKRAYDNLRLQYLLHRFASGAKIEASEDEIMMEILQHSIDAQGKIDFEMYQKRKDLLHDMVANHLKIRKALDFLADNAKKQ